MLAVRTPRDPARTGQPAASHTAPVGAILTDTTRQATQLYEGPHGGFAIHRHEQPQPRCHHSHPQCDLPCHKPSLSVSRRIPLCWHGIDTSFGRETARAGNNPTATLVAHALLSQ